MSTVGGAGALRKTRSRLPDGPAPTHVDPMMSKPRALKRAKLTTGYPGGSGVPGSLVGDQQTATMTNFTTWTVALLKGHRPHDVLVRHGCGVVALLPVGTSL